VVVCVAVALDWDVKLRRFGADGTALGDEFLANTYTTDVQDYPSVAVQPGGGFVAAWHSYGSFGNDPGASVQGRLFAADGMPLGPEFQVNTYTPGASSLPCRRGLDGELRRGLEQRARRWT
jgi:hypothetical protein